MHTYFLDKITNITPKIIKADKVFFASDPVFRDHFPGHPMLPAAMQIECVEKILQIFHWISTDLSKTSVGVWFDQFKFYRPVYPNAKLNVEVKFEHRSGCAYASVLFETYKIFDGYIYYKLFPFNDFHHREYAKQELKKLGYENGKLV